MSFYLDSEGVLKNSLDLVKNVQVGKDDLAKMNYLALLIEENAKFVVINKAQVELVIKRVLFICNMLKQLPNPQPTPQILCVLRSISYLMSLMQRKKTHINSNDDEYNINNNIAININSSENGWMETLIDRFTCADIFAALRRRLQIVWSMHSTANWEREDNEAVEFDAHENAELIINLIHPTRDELSSLSSLGELWGRLRERRLHPEQRYLFNDEKNNIEQWGGGRRRREEEEDEEEEETVFEKEEEKHNTPDTSVMVINSNNNINNNKNTNTVTRTSSPNAATVDDIISYYKRRALSSWRLPQEQLWRDSMSGNNYDDDELVGCVNTRSSSSSSSSSNTNDTHHLNGKWYEFFMNTLRRANELHTIRSSNALRFVIEHGWRYREQHVVVKRLLASTQAQEHFAETLEGFVQDVLVRTQWSYPGLVTCYGGFTETFAEPMEAVKHNVCYKKNEEANALIQSRSYASEKNTNELKYCVAEHDNNNNDNNKPTLCLGMIMEDLSLWQYSPNTESEMSATHKNYNKTSNNININDKLVKQHLYTFIPLQQLLFVFHHRFTVLESIHVTLQLADILQYMLMDANEVPAPVVTCWMTIALSNVFMACSVSHHSAIEPFLHSQEEEYHEHSHEQSDQTHVKEGNESGENQRDDIIVKQRSRDLLQLDGNSVTPKRPLYLNRPDNIPISENYIITPERTAMGEYMIKYAPPLYISHGPLNRWRPHVRAVSPVCYTLAQLLLALITEHAPFPQVRSQRALRHVALGEDASMNAEEYNNKNNNDNNNNNNNNNSFSSSESEAYESMGLGVRTTVKRSAAVGYLLPASLPPKLRSFCHAAMSLDRSRRAMNLDDLRKQLHEAEEEVKVCNITYLQAPFTSRSTFKHHDNHRHSHSHLSNQTQQTEHKNASSELSSNNNSNSSTLNSLRENQGNIEMAQMNERQVTENSIIDDYGEAESANKY